MEVWAPNRLTQFDASIKSRLFEKRRLRQADHDHSCIDRFRRDQITSINFRNVNRMVALRGWSTGRSAAVCPAVATVHPRCHWLRDAMNEKSVLQSAPSGASWLTPTKLTSWYWLAALCVNDFQFVSQFNSRKPSKVTRRVLTDLYIWPKSQTVNQENIMVMDSLSLHVSRTV